MHDLPIRHVITVPGTDCNVNVYRKGTVWHAAGSFKDRSISVTGSSEASALHHWETAAKYQGENAGPAASQNKKA